MTDAVLTIKGLRASYGRAEVLHGIDLQAPKGSVITVIGPNGAGKSTFLNALMGVLPSFGDISFAGRAIGVLSPNHQAPTEEMAFIWSEVLQAPAQLRSMPMFAAVDAATTCKLVTASAKDRELAYWVADDFLRVVAVTRLAWAWTQIGRASAAGSPAGAQADRWQAPARAVQQWTVPECAMRLSIINARVD